MSHISGKLTWNEEVIKDYNESTSALTITLSDSTQRTMNFHNWEKSYPITKEKLFKIKKGSKVKIATWEDWDPRLWFCDVETLTSSPATSR